MPYSTYQRAKDILKPIKGTIGRERLKTEIMMQAGCDERTIEKYMRIMIQLKLLKDVGAGHFEVIHD